MSEYTLGLKEPLSGSGMSENVFGLESSQEAVFGIESGATRSVVARTFASYFRLCLERSGLSQAEFARKTALTRGQITNITKGRRGPPEDAAPWADILGLHGEAREIFLDLAMATYLPERVQDRWWIVLERLHRVESRRTSERSDASNDR